MRFRVLIFISILIITPVYSQTYSYNVETMYFSDKIREGQIFSWLTYENASLNEENFLNPVKNQTIVVEKTPGQQEARAMLTSEYFQYILDGENQSIGPPVLKTTYGQMINMLIIPTVINQTLNLFDIRSSYENNQSITTNNGITNIYLNLTFPERFNLMNYKWNSSYIHDAGIMLFQKSEIYNDTNGELLDESIIVLSTPHYSNYIPTNNSDTDQNRSEKHVTTENNVLFELSFDTLYLTGLIVALILRKYKK